MAVGASPAGLAGAPKPGTDPALPRGGISVDTLIAAVTTVVSPYAPVSQFKHTGETHALGAPGVLIPAIAAHTAPTFTAGF